MTAVTQPVVEMMANMKEQNVPDEHPPNDFAWERTHVLLQEKRFLLSG